MSVVLPAPLGPSSASSSPSRSDNESPSSARTLPKLLRASRISRTAMDASSVGLAAPRRDVPTIARERRRDEAVPPNGRSKATNGPGLRPAGERYTAGPRRRERLAAPPRRSYLSPRSPAHPARQPTSESASPQEVAPCAGEVSPPRC